MWLRTLISTTSAAICSVIRYKFADDNDIDQDTVDKYIYDNRGDFYHTGDDRSNSRHIADGRIPQGRTVYEASPIAYEELDDFNDKYDIWFETPAQLIEEINKFETKNLELVLVNQESDQQLQEWKKKTEHLIETKDEKINTLNEACETLKQKIKHETQALQGLTKERAGMDKTVTMENFDKIKAKVFGMYNNLKGEFDKNSLRPLKSKTDFDNQTMLDILAEVEKLYYKYIKGFRKDTMGAIQKNVSSIEGSLRESKET